MQSVRGVTIGVDEHTFRDKMIADLRERGVSIISLGKGTFDAYVEGVGLVEFKKMEKRPVYYRPTIVFTKDETEALKLLRKKHPYVLVFGDEPKHYYLMKPKHTKQKLSTRMQHETMMITEDRMPVPPHNSYKEFVEACVEEFKRAGPI